MSEFLSFAYTFPLISIDRVCYEHFVTVYSSTQRTSRVGELYNACVPPFSEEVAELEKKGDENGMLYG